MAYERPTYEDKLRTHMDEKPYRPETIQYLGHVCRVGNVSAQSLIGILEVVEEDYRMLAKEQAHDAVFIERTDVGQEEFQLRIADL